MTTQKILSKGMPFQTGKRLPENEQLLLFRKLQAGIMKKPENLLRMPGNWVFPAVNISAKPPMSSKAKKNLLNWAVS